MAKKKTEGAFESALAGLEDVVNKLDGADLTLDKALLYFEQGIGHIRVCEEQLKKADGTLRELLKGENGELVERVIGVSLASALGDQPEED